MPHYYFHVLNQTSYTRDEEGEALSGLDVARMRASDAAGQILTSELHEGRTDVRLDVQVENAQAERLLTVRVTGMIEMNAGE